MAATFPEMAFANPAKTKGRGARNIIRARIPAFGLGGFEGGVAARFAVCPPVDFELRGLNAPPNRRAIHPPPDTRPRLALKTSRNNTRNAIHCRAEYDIMVLFSGVLRASCPDITAVAPDFHHSGAGVWP